MRISPRGIAGAAVIVGLGLAGISCGGRDGLSGFAFRGGVDPAAATVVQPGGFSGYTNYWHSLFWTWTRAGNLFTVSSPDVARTLAKSRVETAEALGLPGLTLAEGFVDAWLRSSPRELEDPSPDDLAAALASSDVLAWLRPDAAAAKRLSDRLPDVRRFRGDLDLYQFHTWDARDILAVPLSREDGRTLLVVVSADAGDRARLRALLAGARDALAANDLHRGWFGTGTLLHSVTCQPGHPLEVIGKGMNQGNDWFTFAGYMDYMLPAELADWLGRVGLDDIATDVGTSRATRSLGSIGFGCRDWSGLKIQDMPSEQAWIDFVKSRGGYVFRPIDSTDCDAFKYDGYIGIDGNQAQVDGEDVPFILQTGMLMDEAPACMVLFTPKGAKFDRDAMWKAILGRKAVGVLAQGRMMGPESLRRALQLLLLDRIRLESLFGDRLDVRAEASGATARVTIRNFAAAPFEGTLRVRPAPELAIDTPERSVRLAAGAETTIELPLRVSAAAMGRANPILATVEGGGARKRTLGVLELPPAVSVHKLLYGQSPEVEYKVSVYNFGTDAAVPVRVRVFAASGAATDKPVFEANKAMQIPPTGHDQAIFALKLDPGAYRVEADALGVTAASQLGVEAPLGMATAKEVDLNGDGVPEIVLENKAVKVTLLSTGARVIEYIVKDRGDNIFFKLWPKREDTDRRPFRERGFYPYGGFEDFLGQASIETHKLYRAVVLTESGPAVQVRMTADYYGNLIEKVFTLYGDSPLLEVRFALTFRNDETNMLGPQPILELGKRHWTEDEFVVPAEGGLRKVRMRPEEFFGEVFRLREGWNAGRDTVEDVAFAGAFPVSEPEFLHMWMNHPSNGESHHYYAEFQPWVPIFRRNVRYFSYYLWGAPGAWEKAVEALRARNLITTK